MLVTHRNTPQHTATHCNTLQYTATIFQCIDDGAYVSVTHCKAFNLHFEAFYCGQNSAHADMELVSNTVFGPMWWEQEQEMQGMEATVLIHDVTRSRPGRLMERDNKVSCSVS